MLEYKSDVSKYFLKKMNKKVLTLTLISIVGLTGCFGGGEDNESSGQNQGPNTVYETDSYSINVPLDWEEINENTLPSNAPQSMEVGFQSNLKSDQFTTNVAINVLELENEISSSDFGKNSQREIRRELTGYREIEAAEIDVAKAEDELAGYLVTYEGKFSPSQPELLFRELYVVDQSIVYIISAASLSEEDEGIVIKAEEMLESFAIK